MTTVNPAGAEGVGLATFAADGAVLDTWFPAPRLTEPGGPGGTSRLRPGDAAADLDPEAAASLGRDELPRCRGRRGPDPIADLSAPPADTHDVWLRLHLLSHRLIRPHGANLDGMFGLLANVAWTTLGPVRRTRSAGCGWRPGPRGSPSRSPASTSSRG